MNDKRLRLNRTLGLVCATALTGCLLTPPTMNAATAAPQKNVDWHQYGGDAGNRYSPLKQINRANVKGLKVAWTFDPEEVGGLQTHPLILGRMMFVYSATQKIYGLDATTGKQIWKFDSGVSTQQPARGFVYWTDGKDKILFATVLDSLWALNPETGKPILSFGNEGRIDLKQGLPKQAGGTLAGTTPGVIYKDLLISGFRTGEARPALHGNIRAFDVHTGKVRWTFHTVPLPDEPGYETWPKDAYRYTGGANSWAGLAIDEKRGIVFAPTGSAATDFFGADRQGKNLYANSLLALDAATGKLIWHFQAVHHDIWDRDFPSPPSLVTVKHDGKVIDAVAQTTKQGVLYLFDRTNGKPIWPVEERSFPGTNVPGETTSPTQPMPTWPEPFARQRLTEDMLTTRTPEAHAWAADEFKKIRSEGQFVPFSADRQTVVFPGFDGGAEWGGSAVDPTKSVIYINANDIAWTGGLKEVPRDEGVGAQLYQSNCAVCHGPDRAGSPPAFPNLIEAVGQLTNHQIADVVHEGRGRMPAFTQFTDASLQTLIDFLRSGRDKPSGGRAEPASAVKSDKEELGTNPAPVDKYRFTGYRKFFDPEGYPAIVPPWGTLNAIDLNTGKYLWRVPLGEYPELAAKGMKTTGTENYGGPIVTAGGLVFIGATIFDQKMRAFDSSTGKLLWEYQMPYAGVATPATYMVEGKQYVVIATSNARNKKAPQGTKYVAFVLP